MNDTLQDLYRVIRLRQQTPSEGSYTSYLFSAGLDKILKKVGEESAETIIAAKNGDPAELVSETADLLFHLLVMLAQRGVSVDEVLAELDRRSQKIGNLKSRRETDKET